MSGAHSTTRHDQSPGGRAPLARACDTLGTSGGSAAWCSTRGRSRCGASGRILTLRNAIFCCSIVAQTILPERAGSD